jgi:hypothetical protein
MTAKAPYVTTPVVAAFGLSNAVLAREIVKNINQIVIPKRLIAAPRR